MLARATRGEKILYDLIRRMELLQEELARAKSQLTQAERGSRSKAEFARLREQRQLARVEWGVFQGECDHAYLRQRRWLES